jgi:tRNA threonylcarbamoyladenosine biosynthesis protein TsaE
MIELADEAATRAFGAALAPHLRAGDVIKLEGALGAGKTSLARGLLGALGHEGEVPSPSFAIVQPYDSLPLPVWHVDLYRVEDRSELEQLGLEDALIDGALIVEWPERAGSARWPDALCLSLQVPDEGPRRLTATVPSSWEDRWPPSI